MADGTRQRREEIVQLLVLVVALLGGLIWLQFTAISQFDPAQLTGWTVGVGLLLVIGAIAIPAVLFAKWASEDNPERSVRSNK